MQASYSIGVGSVNPSFNAYQTTGIAGIHIYGTVTLKSGISTPSRQKVYVNFDNSTYTTLIQLFVGNGNTNEGEVCFYKSICLVFKLFYIINN